MTMQHPIHPDDERLAALAGGDPEVAADDTLRAHVDSCDRCTDLVRELGMLRATLGELPDLVPSRPLQLLPPVADPKVPVRGGWLRRLAGPAMAAGLVLVVAGAIGTSGFTIGMGASAGAAPTTDRAEFPLGAPSAEAGEGAEAPGASQGDFEPSAHGLSGGSDVPRPAASGGYDSGSQRSRSERPSASQSGTDAVPPAGANGGTPELFVSTDPRLPWLIVLGLGVGLLFAGIFLRFARQPRAG